MPRLSCVRLLKLSCFLGLSYTVFKQSLDSYISEGYGLENRLHMSSSLFYFVNTTLVEYDDNQQGENQEETEINREMEENETEENQDDTEIEEDVEEGYKEETEKYVDKLEDEAATVIAKADSPGERGEGVVLNDEEKLKAKVEISEGWKDNAFNSYVSSLISLDRSLPDARHPACLEQGRYLPVSALPATSVIITFHNEAWSTLLRTVHSVIGRSPPELMREIILVDDASTREQLKAPLEQYIKRWDFVKIYRAPDRVGLIRGRLLGASKAAGPVLTFLDSHCECTEGWLEPLLDRIARNSSNVVCPVIDSINDDTFKYNYKKPQNGAINVGGFNWNLIFTWHPAPPDKRPANPSDPVPSPTMAGGLFSISKEFFEKIGTYDPGFDIWGGENLELSFKTWMCGGSLEILPCSHVGHVFRSRSPYKWRPGTNSLKRNSVRLAEVWLDDYKKIYYERINNNLGRFGDLTSRKSLRSSLECHSFSWYLDTVYPEVFRPDLALSKGKLRSSVAGLCLTAPAGKKKDVKNKPVYASPCVGHSNPVWNVQTWYLTQAGEIRRDDLCLDHAGGGVLLYGCHGLGGNQYWMLDSKTLQVQHTTGKCMAVSGKEVIMEECRADNMGQKWKF